MRKFQLLFVAIATLLTAVPAFAQTSAGGTTVGDGLVAIAAARGMGLAAGLCAMGQGRAAASTSEAVARNPGARPTVLLLLTLGLAFMESLALFTLVIIFVKVKG